MDINNILLQNIMALIELHGLNETQCLAQCNIHSNFLTNLRTGLLQKPSFEYIYSIAKFFNVSIDSLICEETAVKYMESHNGIIDKCDAKVITSAYNALDEKGQAVIMEIIKKEQNRIRDNKKFAK